jgi:hypothetical protein
VRAGDRLRLGATIAFEFGPDTGECKQRAIIIERKPDDILLFGLRIRLRRILGKTVCRDQASAFRFQPAAPVVRGGVADFCGIFYERPPCLAEAAALWLTAAMLAAVLWIVATGALAPACASRRKSALAEPLKS